MRFAAALVTEDAGGPIVASVTASFHVLAPLDDPDTEIDELDLTERLDGDVANGSGAGDEGAVETFTAQRSRVTLPAGPAVRIERVMQYGGGDSYAQDVYSVQYVLPLDEHGLSLTITGTSPAIRRKDDLDRIFAEIAETMRIER